MTTRSPRFGFLLMTEPNGDARTARQVLELARYLDGTAFDALFFVDHFFLAGDRYLAEGRDVDRPHQWEAFTAMASVAAVTERLRVGTLVTPVPLRHPAFVAKAIATIDVFSGGRVVLGAGAGWNPTEYTAYGVPFTDAYNQRLEQLGEGIEIMRALWTSPDPVTYDGRHYHLKEAPLFPKPVQQPPPIWLGGSGPKILDLTARLGDAWTPAAPHYNAVSPETYAAGLQTIRAKAREYGRDASSILAAVLLNTSAAANRQDAHRKAVANTLRDDWAHLTPEDMSESGVLVLGDPDDCVRHLRRYLDVGAEYVTICPIPMTMENALETARLYAESVLPQLAGGPARG